MGLQDEIMTLETRLEAGQNVGDELAAAYAEMILRKNSKRLVWSWFDQFARLLKEMGRYEELIAAAGGADPTNFGPWDAQDAVGAWLEARPTGPG